MADQSLKDRIEAVLRNQYSENAYIDVSDGYLDKVHVIVVSNELDPYSESEKQEILWDLLDKGGLTEEEKSKISLVLPLSRTNLK